MFQQQQQQQPSPHAYVFTQVLGTVLGRLQQRGVITQEMGNRMHATQMQWSNQFLYNMPNGVNPQQMQDMLENYIIQMVHSSSNSVQQYGPQAPNYAPMGNGGGGNGMFNTPGINNMGASQKLFGNGNKAPVVPDVPAAATFIPPDMSMVENDAPYKPEWTTNRELIMSTDYKYDDISVNTYSFPNDDRENRTTTFIINWPHVISTDHRLFELMDIVSGTGKEFIGLIAHKETTILNLSNEDVAVHLAAIKDISSNKGSNAAKFKTLIAYFDTKPRGVFDAFERMITSMFNEALSSRLMHDTTNLNLRLQVDGLDTIMSFIPGNNNVTLDALVNTPKYADMFDSVLRYVFSRLCTSTITTDTKIISDALYAISGEDAIKAYSECLKGNKKSDELTVLVYTTETAVTNLQLNKSLTYRGLAEGVTAVSQDVCTCALDQHLKQCLSSSIKPLRVISTCGESFHISWTSDHVMIYTK